MLPTEAILSDMRHPVPVRQSPCCARVSGTFDGMQIEMRDQRADTEATTTGKKDLRFKSEREEMSLRNR